LTLKDVLHIPKSPCNGFNPSASPNIWIKNITNDGYTDGYDIEGKNKDRSWYAEPFHGRERLALAFSPPDESVRGRTKYARIERFDIHLNAAEWQKLDRQGCFKEYLHAVEWQKPVQSCVKEHNATSGSSRLNSG
jgi:hypothetical protein